MSDVLAAMKGAGKGIDAALKKILESRARGPAARMHKMSQYFLGFLDEKLNKSEKTRGKRFRPTLCLYLADAYGVRNKVWSATLAIELFHNFTLIHDDVEDNDETRRGKQTVWKLFGVNHAINAGDALSLIAGDVCIDVAKESPELAHALFGTFIEVTEGQYLDFELAEKSISKVTDREYLAMARKKAGVLVGISAEAPGIAKKISQKERDALRGFGISLGTAYQIADDYRSLWGKNTGKDVYGDVRERKRSYPAILAAQDSNGRARGRLSELFDLDRRLHDLEVIETVSLIDSTHAQAQTLAAARHHITLAENSVAALSLPQEMKQSLIELIRALIPEDA